MKFLEELLIKLYGINSKILNYISCKLGYLKNDNYEFKINFLLRILQVKEDFVLERQIVSCFWLWFSLHFSLLFGFRLLTWKNVIFYWIGNRFIRSVMDQGALLSYDMCNRKLFDHLEFKYSHDHNYKFKPFMNYFNFNKMNVMIKSFIQII